MSSATSTKRQRQTAPATDTGFHPWHYFLLVATAAATAAVMLSKQTHPAALLMLSAAALSCGLVGWAIFRAMSGFLGADNRRAPLASRELSALEREKALTLRAIKELEFDRAMGKVSEADFVDLSGRLRARALVLMQDLERPVATKPVRVDVRAAEPESDRICASCSTENDDDAKFCKRCGKKL